MLANTITLPVTGGDVVLTKKNESGGTSEYGLITSTLIWTLRVRHSTVKVGNEVYHRHNLEVVKTTLQAGDVPEYYQKFYFVLENKPGDVTVTMPDAVCDLAIASSNALLNSLVQNEA
nr:MAG: coat protein [Leviviridae sp.]